MARHVREGFKNLWRNGWMTFASVSAVAITLLILGVFLTVALNAQQMANYVTRQLEIEVFLKPSISDAQGEQVAQAVRQLPGVASVQYFSKEDGFAQLRRDISPQYRALMDGLSAKNTLPVKLVVKATSPDELLPLGQELRRLPSVYQVNDGRSVVDKLLHLFNVLRNLGLVFVVGLTVTAMFLIANTIKITIFSRRREIEIMKLVGATNWFIRWPFLMEGMMIGVLGAALPYALLVWGYASIYQRMSGTFFILPFPLVPASDLAIRLAEVMFGLGIAIGVWGGAMSIRRFLRV
ncbi:cell division protein FtsX [Alicyclobacillus cellulosilyticus]|uniref:Cell division protein FtsX n=1 Tax=Alicyclobacillus cellulosilyticus TaxID=1003997 RepID=A0A917NJU6_9BACL|nr:permease-like cell division protein FtsX [Alicyclobacillus cellulosilyticus]GGJ05875.1 cell division protein FtsX [Alicyclobacillus cellulosilyticus]